MSKHVDTRPPGEFDLLVLWGWIKAAAAPFLGYLTAVLRSRYQSGRKSWRATHLGGFLIALATVAAKPMIAALGLSSDMAYFAAVYMGFVGVETLSGWLRRVGDNRIQ